LSVHVLGISYGRDVSFRKTVGLLPKITPHRIYHLHTYRKLNN